MSASVSNKVLQHLRLKWLGRPCPMCNGGPWSVAGSTFELREFHGGDFVLGGGGSILPIVPVTCENCGYTVLVNAIKVGIVSQNTQQPS